MTYRSFLFAVVLMTALTPIARAADDARASFFEHHCVECHDADARKGDLDLTSLPRDYANPEAFARWVKVYDRVRDGTMPPKKKPRPTDLEMQPVLAALSNDLTAAALARRQGGGRATDRRLDREEYQNTLRDLLALP